jgi:hypothetical protein
VYLIYLPSIKPSRAPNDTTLNVLLRIDWVGFTLSAGALVTFVMAMTFGGSTWAWNDHRTIATFCVSGALIILTVLQQHYLLFTKANQRMVPPGYIIKDRSQILLMIETATAALNIYIPLYYLSLYFQFTRGDDAVKASIRLLPFVLILVTTNMASGFFFPKINY